MGRVSGNLCEKVIFEPRAEGQKRSSPQEIWLQQMLRTQAEWEGSSPRNRDGARVAGELEVGSEPETVAGW